MIQPNKIGSAPFLLEHSLLLYEHLNQVADTNPHAVILDTLHGHLAGQRLPLGRLPCSKGKKLPRGNTKEVKVSRRSSLYRYCFSKVSVFSNCPTAAPIGVLSIQLHFLHAPSHSSFHVRNLSVCLCISCALHT